MKRAQNPENADRVLITDFMLNDENTEQEAPDPFGKVPAKVQREGTFCKLLLGGAQQISSTLVGYSMIAVPLFLL